ncbi:MAG: hypothetical protein JWO53_1007 [Chlamydiia bacterium]|nr:hypothetical protein [Chlamydiia bacterium]
MTRALWIFLVSLALIITSFVLISHFSQKGPKPRISIITSVWNGDDFIKGFLEDITKQTIFSECELIMVNANSPGTEEPIIKEYMKRYPNIVYVKLDKDPGLYSVWNYAIKMARSDIISNANLDDCSCYDALEVHAKALETDPSVDLVYAGYYITEHPHETFANNHYRWYVDPLEFSLKNLITCAPGPRPVWRKSLHKHYGYFDETFVSAGDHEMWLRAATKGSRFKKLPGLYTLYYMNPKGLSTDKDERKEQQRVLENERLKKSYGYLWGF